MPPALGMCLCLVGLLFSSIMCFGTYSSLKIENPEKHSLFAVQRRLSENFEMENFHDAAWSKAGRWVGFLISLFISSVLISGVVWFGFQWAVSA